MLTFTFFDFEIASYGTEYYIRQIPGAGLLTQINQSISISETENLELSVTCLVLHSVTLAVTQSQEE